LDTALWGIRARTSEASLNVHCRAIIVVTDGDDTSSVTDVDGVLETATRPNAAIYIIGLFNRAVPETEKSREAQFELGRTADRRPRLISAAGRKPECDSPDRSGPS
jgi:malate synthase